MTSGRPDMAMSEAGGVPEELEYPAEIDLPITDTAGAIPGRNAALQPERLLYAVRSDDGFKLTEGPTYTNLTLGLFDGGRGNGAASTMYVTVLTNGLYPMRLLYFQAGSGGNLEFYSINNGTPTLINDTNSTAIKAFQVVASAALPVTILNPAHTGNATTFNFLTQPGHTHYIEYKNDLSDVTWLPLTTVGGDGSVTNITDNTASGATRFLELAERGVRRIESSLKELRELHRNARSPAPTAPRVNPPPAGAASPP